MLGAYMYALYHLAIYQTIEFMVFWKQNTLEDFLGGETSE